jgi:hypothetical protein
LVRRSFDPVLLERLRNLDCARVLAALDGHFKQDRSFVPVKNKNTQRWHCCTVCGDFELLITGSKWFDARQRKGGGGAIDLVMALTGCSFVDAVRVLVDRGL